MQAHLEARQREDLRRDLAQRLRAHPGPYQPGEGVWYWDRDQNKIRGGEWRKAKVVSVGKPPMVTIEMGGRMTLTNCSKIRKNPDPWHDVVAPGIDGREGVVTVPGLGADREDPDATPTGEDLADRPAGLRPAQGSGEDLMYIDEHRAPQMGFYLGGRVFQQVCTSSEILSVTLAQSTIVEPPIHVDQSFTWGRAKKLCDDLEKRPIQCVWVSISDRGIDKAAIAELGSRIPAIQRRSNRQFVFAMPWHSQMWKMAWARSEVNWYGVDCIDVQAYDNRNTWTDHFGSVAQSP